MFKGKSLTDFTNLFSPNDLKKNNDMILNCFLNELFSECNSVECSSIERNECNSVEASNLNNQQFKLNKINEIKDYIIAETR